MEHDKIIQRVVIKQNDKFYDYIDFTYVFMRSKGEIRSEKYR